MRQVLFEIPLHRLADGLPDVPIHGYGFMLFLAFVLCTWLATRLARQQGVKAEHVQDLAIWIFVFGIVGARATYMIQYGVPLSRFYVVWEGGLVFYGSAIGGVVGFLGAYWFQFRKHGISPWKVLDVLAPCIALGLCIGRVGCLLNGCCFGGVACPDCPAVSFPLPTAPREAYVRAGVQTAAGFTMRLSPGEDPRTVGAVEPNAPAARAGLRPGDVIEAVNGQPVADYGELWDALVAKWPRGRTGLELTVRRGEQTHELSYTPYTVGLHPTQLYESVSTGLLAFLLLAYWPFRRRDGELMVLLMLGYSVHRFVNEVLRDDTDPVAFGLTLSQNLSVAFFVGGLALWAWLPRRPVGPAPATPGDTPAAGEPQVAAAPQTALQDEAINGIVS